MGEETRMVRSNNWLRRKVVRRRVVAALVVLGVVALAISGCSGAASRSSAWDQEPAASVSSGFPVTVTDDASRTVTIERRPERIVSLAPANTETLFALGLGDEVEGVTTYCDYPAEAQTKPKVGDFVTPNLEAIAAARPDLVLATGGVQADFISKLESLGAQVVVLDPQTIEGVRHAIELTGRVTGATTEAQQADDAIQAAVDQIKDAAPQGAQPVSAFIEIGQNPLFTAGAGTLLDDMVRAAYGTNVVSEPGYVAYSLEQLTRLDPDVYLATKGSMSDPSDLAKRAGYKQLRAVTGGRVYVLDDNLVTRPGPRIGEGLLSVAKALHPDWFAD
jgi:iron complex transport system substrate-binding protein